MNSTYTPPTVKTSLPPRGDPHRLICRLKRRPPPPARLEFVLTFRPLTLDEISDLGFDRDRLAAAVDYLTRRGRRILVGPFAIGKGA